MIKGVTRIFRIRNLVWSTEVGLRRRFGSGDRLCVRDIGSWCSGVTLLINRSLFDILDIQV